MKKGLAILFLITSCFAGIFAGSAPKFDHVIVVMMENHSYSQIIGYAGAPYLNGLADSGALFTSSYAITHPSQPNYLDIYSGSDQGVSDDNVPANAPFSTSNLGAELIANSYTFNGYSEDLPSVGYTGATSGNYARKHCPWVNWQGSGANQVSPSISLPFSSFPSDFTTLPTVAFVIPNLNDDMHNGTTPEGDAWLKANINTYAAWAKLHNSLLIITWDEDNDSDNNHIATIFYGANIIKGQYSEKINHYDILRTIEAMYGLTPIANSSTLSPITDVWQNANGIDAAGLQNTSISAYAPLGENKINLRFSGTIPVGRLNICLMDINGKKIEQTAFSASEEYNFHIPVCPSGCYIIDVYGSNFSFRKKVVIVN